MSSVQRITIAVVALALVVALGYWLRDFTGSDDDSVTRGSAGPSEIVDDSDPPLNTTEARRGAATKRPWRDVGAGGVSGVLREYGTERALEGVEITLGAEDGPKKRMTSKTAADGSFHFDDVAAYDDWRAFCPPQGTLGGLDLGGIRVAPDDVTDLGVLYLTSAFVIEGDVVDQVGRPVAGAEVRIVRPEVRVFAASEIITRLSRMASRPEPVDRARTDSAGRFKLSRATPGIHDFEVSAEGFATLREDGVSVTPVTVGERLRFVVHGGTRLTGRVIRTGGDPVGGARLAAMLADRPEQIFMGTSVRSFVTTETDGSFTFLGLDSGEMIIAVEIDDEPIRYQKEVIVPSEAPLVIVAGGSARLEGRVTDKDGLPVKGATVTVMQESGDLPSLAIGVTDDDGRYAISGLMTGRVREILVRAQGFALWPFGAPSSQRRDAKLTKFEEGTQRMDIVLDRGATVAGRVFEAGTDKPLSGVRVSLMTTGAAALGDNGDFTDAEGRFELHGLVKGDGILRARKTGWSQVGDFQPFDMIMAGGGAVRRAGKNNPELLVQVADDSPLTDRRIEMAPAPVVHGRVVDQDGNGIGGARVAFEVGGGKIGIRGELELTRTVSDASGGFRLTLDGGSSKGSISATARGYALSRLKDIHLTSAVDAANEFTIRLERAAEVRGWVLDPSGRPIAGAAVELSSGDPTGGGEESEEDDADRPERDRTAEQGEDEPEFVEPQRKTTSTEGTFAFTSLSAGRVRLRASHPDHRRGKSLRVEVLPGVTTEAKLVLEPGLAIRGRLSDPDGKPVSGWFVHLEPVEPSMELEEAWSRYVEGQTTRVSSGGDGTFAIRGLPAGIYEVWANLKKGEITARVRATAGGPEIQLVTGTAPRLAGIVTFGGAPMPRATVKVRLSGGEGPESTESTKDDGTFEIYSLEEGANYDIEVVVQGQAGRSLNVRPARRIGVPFPTNDLRIALEPGLTIAGTVVIPAGRPTDGWYILAHRAVNDAGKLGLVGSAQVEGGRFELTGLEEGEVLIEARHKDGTQSERMPVSAGATDVVITIP